MLCPLYDNFMDFTNINVLSMSSFMGYSSYQSAVDVRQSDQTPMDKSKIKDIFARMELYATETMKPGLFTIANLTL